MHAESIGFLPHAVTAPSLTFSRPLGFSQSYAQVISLHAALAQMLLVMWVQVAVHTPFKQRPTPKGIKDVKLQLSHTLLHTVYRPRAQ
jgi:hypothetical protein